MVSMAGTRGPGWALHPWSAITTEGTLVDASHPLDWAALAADRRARLAAALPILCEALADADGYGPDAWQFAVTLGELTAAGLRATDLRWLTDRGLVGHAEELARRVGKRRFAPSVGLSVTARSCFVLTAAGRLFCDAAPATRTVEASGTDRPHWDIPRRELTWRGVVVKRFRTPADCQELILAAFQEEEWPPRIDDPLGRGGGQQSPQQRLQDTVRALNRHQLAARVRFARDGTGQGVRWAA